MDLTHLCALTFSDPSLPLSLAIDSVLVRLVRAPSPLNPSATRHSNPPASSGDRFPAYNSYRYDAKENAQTHAESGAQSAVALCPPSRGHRPGRRLRFWGSKERPSVVLGRSTGQRRSQPCARRRRLGQWARRARRGRRGVRGDPRRSASRKSKRSVHTPFPRLSYPPV